MTKWQEYRNRSVRRHGNKFDESDLDPRFIQFYETGQRIKVETLGMTLTGTVGVTTGWKPSFLLMRTSRSIGSSWLMGKETKIVGVQVGRKYMEVI